MTDHKWELLEMIPTGDPTTVSKFGEHRCSRCGIIITFRSREYFDSEEQFLENINSNFGILGAWSSVWNKEKIDCDVSIVSQVIDE